MEKSWISRTGTDHQTWTIGFFLLVCIMSDVRKLVENRNIPGLHMSKASTRKMLKSREIRNAQTQYFKKRLHSVDDSDCSSSDSEESPSERPFRAAGTALALCVEGDCTDDEMDYALPTGGIKKRKRVLLERAFRKLHSVRASMAVCTNATTKVLLIAFLHIYVQITPQLPTASQLAEKVNDLQMKDEQLWLESKDVVTASPPACDADAPDGLIACVPSDIRNCSSKNPDVHTKIALKNRRTISDRINALTLSSTAQEVFSIIPDLPDLYSYLLLLLADDCAPSEYSRTSIPTEAERTKSRFAEMKANLEAVKIRHRCVVCRERRLEHVCVPCGHVMCHKCVMKEAEQCICCGEHVELVAQVFTV